MRWSPSPTPTTRRAWWRRWCSRPSARCRWSASPISRSAPSPRNATWCSTSRTPRCTTSVRSAPRCAWRSRWWWRWGRRGSPRRHSRRSVQSALRCQPRLNVIERYVTAEAAAAGCRFLIFDRMGEDNGLVGFQFLQVLVEPRILALKVEQAQILAPARYADEIGIRDRPYVACEPRSAGQNVLEMCIGLGRLVAGQSAQHFPMLRRVVRQLERRPGRRECAMHLRVQERQGAIEPVERAGALQVAEPLTEIACRDMAQDRQAFAQRFAVFQQQGRRLMLGVDARIALVLGRQHVDAA